MYLSVTVAAYSRLTTVHAINAFSNRAVDEAEDAVAANMQQQKIQSEEAVGRVEEAATEL
jgi:hypothetical protein